MKIIKIISGGQSGADQAGLFTARQFGISIGGHAPKHYMTSNGPNLDLLYTYGLEECEGGYAERTYLNVKNSDCTLRFAYKFDTPGEICTLKAIRQYRKPFYDIDLKVDIDIDKIVNWFNAVFNDNKIILNVAGNRNSKDFDVFDKVCRIFSNILKKVDYGYHKI